MVVFISFFLGRIAAAASNSDYCYTFLCSMVYLSVVCLSSVCLSVCHNCASCLNRSMDLYTIWQVHLCGPVTHCVIWGFLTPRGEGEIWGLTPANLWKKMIYDSPGGSIDQQFHRLWNYFGPCYFCSIVPTADAVRGRYIWPICFSSSPVLWRLQITWNCA